MRHLAAVLLFAFAATSSQAAIEKVRIKATRKLESSRTSQSQAIPHGQTSLEQKQYFYRFDLQRSATEAPETAVVEWIILVEDASGRLQVGQREKKQVELPYGREVSVETKPVELTERNWSRGGRVGEIGDKIAGYGLRILSTGGDLVAEKYEPSSMEKQIDWQAKERREAPAGFPGPQRDVPRRFQPQRP